MPSQLATLALLATTIGAQSHALPHHAQRIIPVAAPQSNLPVQSPEFRFNTPPDQLRVIEPLHNSIDHTPRYQVDTPTGTATCIRSGNTIICP